MTLDKTLLFVNPQQVDDTVHTHLGEEVEFHPYDYFFTYLKELGAELRLHKEAVRNGNDSGSYMRLSVEQQVLVGDKASLAIVEAIGVVRDLLRPHASWGHCGGGFG